MRAWNLTLRFTLEVAAITGVGWAAVSESSGSTRWVAVIALPLAVAGLWGTFNVPDDPSRSGEAPVAVAGWFRLALELLLLSAGWVSFVIVGHPYIGIGFAGLTALHYAASRPRIRWLLTR